VGDIGIVTYAGRGACSVKFPKHNMSWDMYFHEIEPVEADTESEIARLVRVANEGAAAEHKLLTDYLTQVERKHNKDYNKTWHTFTSNPYNGYTKYRVKPKRPEPITLSTGWKVE